jgi:SEC-C motif domain protein
MAKHATNSKLTSEVCPCGGTSYASCCAPLHLGAPEPTPEALMRSRYSAYVLKLADYLLQSWHPETRPGAIEFDPACVWLGLSVKRSQQNAEQSYGEVEFVARYRIGGASAVRMYEHSEFLRVAERWLYWRAQPDQKLTP